MKKDLRKVQFNLNGANVFGFPKMTTGDYDGEVDYYLTEREGYFHQWGEMIQKDADDKPFSISCGIVEDEDGKVFLVPPTNIQFHD